MASSAPRARAARKRKAKAEAFAQRLRSAREACGLTQAQLAERAGFQPSAISRFEIGKQEPSLANFSRLCEALRLDPGVLLGNNRILVDPAEGLEDDEDRYLIRTLVARLGRAQQQGARK